MPIDPSVRANHVRLARTLEHALGFNRLDLELNREGRLSRSQVHQLIARILRPVAVAALTLLCWAVFWVVYLLGVLHRPWYEVQGEIATRIIHPHTIFLAQWANLAYDRSPLLYTGAALSFFFLCLLGLTRVPWKLLFDVIAGHVECAQGRVAKGEEETKTHRDAGVRYYYRLPDEQPFEVSQLAYRALESGNSYGLFYLPRSRMLVAVEPHLDPGQLPRPLAPFQLSAPIPASGLAPPPTVRPALNPTPPSVRLLLERLNKLERH